MNEYSGYQTILRGNGEIVPGVFPTLEWFDKIKVHVPFKGKSVLDVGCCEGMYGILALKEGASDVIGIEEEKQKADNAIQLAKEHNVPLAVINNKIQEVELVKHIDILLLPMIIHWIGKEQTRRLISWAKDYVVFIYREANDDYKEENGTWFPTEKELDTLRGVRRIYSETLMVQDEDKKINLAIYEKYVS